MRLDKKYLALGAAALGALALSLSATSEQSAQLHEHNNDRAIATQVFGGLQEDSGAVEFSYYGNMAFEIVSPQGVKIFIDPWRNDKTGMFPPWFMRDMPIVRTDIGLITHAHYDHDAIERLRADMVFDRMAGEFTHGDVKITGIADKHVCETQGDFAYREPVKWYLGDDPCPPGEKLQWNNSVYVIETGGLRILHWGDNRQNPSQHVWDLIGDIDVAILAISDEGHILSKYWANQVMEQTKANVVIPSHYYVPGVHIAGVYGLKTADEWTAEHEHTLLDSAVLKLTPQMVEPLNHHVMYFGPHVAFPTEYPETPPGSEFPVPDPAEAWRRFNPKSN